MKRMALLLPFMFLITVVFSTVYKVGIYDNPPLCFERDGKAAGFYIDVLNDMAEKNDLHFDYTLYPFNQAYELLQNGEIDILVALTKTAEREQYVNFNEKAFMTSWAVIYTRVENSYNTFVDLEDKSVGLLKNGVFGQRLIEEMALYQLAFKPVFFDTYGEILMAIESKQVDAGVVNRFSESGWKDMSSIIKPITTFSPMEAFLGFSKATGPKLIPIVDRYLNVMIENENSEYYDFVRKWLIFKAKAGDLFYIYLLIFLLILGLCLAVYFIIRLISRLRKRFSDYMDLSEEFKTILNSIGDAVVWTDSNGRIEGMNPIALKLTGFELKEVLGRSINDIVLIRRYLTKEEIKVPVEKIVSEKTVFTIAEDIELVSKNKRSILVGDSIAPILDDFGDVKGIVVVFRDITEKRKDEMALADSENRFRAFVNSFPAAVFIKDSELRNVFLNTYFETYYVDDLEKWNGKTAEEIFGGELGKKMYASDIEVLNSNLQIIEEKMMNKFGEIRYLKTYKFPIEKKDGEKYLGGFSMDITELKQVMNDLEEAKKEAEKVNNMKDIFLANINHEIRTPLNGIKGLLAFFDRQGLSENQMEYIHMLEYSADRLKRLVDDILDFSKLNLDRIQIEKRPVKLDEMCRVIHSEYRKRAEEKGLTFTCEFLNREVNEVLLDPLRFEQIIHNLLSNSLKFTDKGSVTLTGDYISMDADSGILKIEISDTGVGMKQETVDKIFNYFYQGDQSYTKKFQGTGIGMALVKRLLDLMEGEIHISSILNEGTHYTLTVPVEIDKQIAENKRCLLANGELPYRGVKFLIVEDDQINRLILRKALLKTGAEIFEAENGKTALKLIKKEKPDLVFMDIQMPDISGLDVIRAIRNSSDALIKNIRIVAVSGYSQEKEIDVFLETGADDFISKPIDNQTLFEVIRKSLLD